LNRFRRHGFGGSVDLISFLEGKIGAVESELLGAMIGDVMWKGNINEGVNKLVDASIALPLHVMTFEEVVPAKDELNLMSDSASNR
jgi:hypothetical protein